MLGVLLDDGRWPAALFGIALAGAFSAFPRQFNWERWSRVAVIAPLGLALKALAPSSRLLSLPHLRDGTNGRAVKTAEALPAGTRFRESETDRMSRCVVPRQSRWHSRASYCARSRRNLH